MSQNEAGPWWLMAGTTDDQATGAAPASGAHADDAAPLLHPGLARLFAKTLTVAPPAAVGAALAIPRWQLFEPTIEVDLRAALAASGAWQAVGKRHKRRLQQHWPSRLQHATCALSEHLMPGIALRELLDAADTCDALVLHGLPEPVAFLRVQWPALRQLLLAQDSRQARARALHAALDAVSRRDRDAILASHFVIRSEPWTVAGSGRSARQLSVALSKPGEWVSGAALLAQLAERDDYDQVVFNDPQDSYRERELPMVSWGPSVARTLLCGQSALALEDSCLGPVLQQLHDYDQFLLPRWLRPVSDQDRHHAARCLQLMAEHAEPFAALCRSSATGQVTLAQMHHPDGSRLIRQLVRPLDPAWWQSLSRRARRVQHTRWLLGLF